MIQADKVGKQVRLVHVEMVPDACIEHLLGYILVIGQHMVERIIDAVGGILLAMAVGRQYEDTFSGTGQFLPVASIGSVKYGNPDVETGVSRTYRDRARFSSR